MSTTKIRIKTDNKWKDFKNADEVPAKILASDFDYQNRDEIFDGFFCYNEWWYHLDEFMTVENIPELKGWNGYKNDSFFSGVVIKVSDDCEQYKVGTFFATTAVE